MNNFKNRLYFVHAVDTEGPISESIDDTFERLKLLFNIDLTPNIENLIKLQNKEVFLDGIEETVANCISPKRLNFIKDLSQLDKLLDKIFSSSFRNKFLDSFGNPYRFTWFCLDHVGFQENPRRRLLGFHTILKIYLSRLKKNSDFGDTIQWHYHGVPFNRKAHCFGLNWNFKNYHIEIFTRRLIDFNIFANAFRAGGWIERPDMSNWLEQWIPFDFSNHSYKDKSNQPDYKNGRFADWSRAPKTWCGYHPDKYDLQKEGNMSRTIFRSLSLDARIGSITEEDIELAFLEALENKNPILSVTNHDCRDMVEEIESFWPKILKAMKKFPSVNLIHTNEIDAAKNCLNLRDNQFNLNLNWEDNKIIVESNSELFGPQPFLAFKTHSGEYFHDNMANHGDLKWSYEFDWMTLPKESLKKVAVASADRFGNVSTANWEDTN